MSENATAYRTTIHAGHREEWHTVTLQLPAWLVADAEAECAAQTAALPADAPGVGLADLVTACLAWALHGRCVCGLPRVSDPDDRAWLTAWGRAKEVTA